MGFLKNIVSNITGNTPLVIHFAVVKDGIGVGILRKGHIVLPNEVVSSGLSKKLPSPLLHVIANVHQKQDPMILLSLPSAKQLANDLQPFRTEILDINTQALDQLETIKCPPEFRVYWEYSTNEQTLIRKLRHANNYLGDGWYQGTNEIWCISEGLSEKNIGWLNLSQISSEHIFTFISNFLPNARKIGLPAECELTIVDDFRLSVHIENMTRQALDVRVDSNYPDLLSHLQPLKGDNDNMISGMTLIPLIRPLMKSALGDIATIGKAQTISNANIPIFIQDSVKPFSRLILIDLNLLTASYPIVDAATLTREWQLEYAINSGIGEYNAVAYLTCQAEKISFTTVVTWAKKGARFLECESGWLELTPNFKQKKEVQNEEVAFKLTVQELLGTWQERLRHVEIQLPKVTFEREKTEQESAEKFLETMRQYGIPAVVSGLQQDIIGIIRNICVYLRKDNPKAHILWIVSQRKKANVIKELQRSGLSPKNFFAASPDELSPKWTAVDWTLIILQDVDVLTSHPKQAKYYSQLPRLWTVATVSNELWYHNNQRLLKVLMALRLRQEDSQAFLTTCFQSYTDQSETFLERLGSPFKKIFVSGNEPDRGIPIPPRSTAPSSRPQLQTPRATPPNISISFTSGSSGEDFVQQAKKYASHTEKEVAPVPFMQYWPTYSAMTPPQRKWYFYWRSQVRQGNFYAIDLSYLFVYTYEIINVIGFESPRAAFDHANIFWQHYRKLQPKLDRYLVDWIADFTLIHKLDITPLDWYAQALNLGAFSSDVDLSIEAWLRGSADVMALPPDLLFKLADYSPAKNKFYKQYQGEMDLDAGFQKGLQAVNQYFKATTGKNLFETHRPKTARMIARTPFASALHDYKQQSIQLAKVHPWMGSELLSERLKQIMRHTENVLRAQATFKSKLRGIELPNEWLEIIEKALEPEPIRREIIIDRRLLPGLIGETEEVRKRLMKDDVVAAETIIEQTPADEPVVSQADYTIRPTNTEEGLLTDLVGVARIMQVHDDLAAKLLRMFHANSWQVTATNLQASLPEGVFLNVLLDQINDAAFDELEQALLFEEDGTWVVEEDYRDEIVFILEHPDFSEAHSTDTRTAFDDLTDEWGEFAKQLQSHHWEALAALLSKTDVKARLDAVARSVYSTSNQIIDDINNFALDNVGDIVIDTYRDIPEIEAEDFESLAKLLDWSLKYLNT